MGAHKSIKIYELNRDLADLWFSIACMVNATLEYDYSRIEGSYREEAKKRTNLMAYGMLVIYQFAFFEDSIPWEIWKNYEVEEKIKRLMAYRHVRHCYAHSYDGKRVYRSKKESENFDVIMVSETPLKGVAVDENDCINITIDSIEELNSLLRSASGIHILHALMPQAQ